MSHPSSSPSTTKPSKSLHPQTPVDTPRLSSPALISRLTDSDSRLRTCTMQQLSLHLALDSPVLSANLSLPMPNTEGRHAEWELFGAFGSTAFVSKHPLTTKDLLRNLINNITAKLLRLSCPPPPLPSHIELIRPMCSLLRAGSIIHSIQFPFHSLPRKCWLSSQLQSP